MRLHDIVGSVARRAASRFGVGRFEQALIRELAAKLPLPFDLKAVAVARGIQMTGIALCVAEGKDLRRCECFIDLALAETKERAKQIMSAALDDWNRLGNFAPAGRADHHT